MDLLDRLRLDVPVAQAGMGGGLAGPELAAAVAAAGGLGTLGLAPPAQLRRSIEQVRDEADGRAVAINLLMPFTRRSHVDTCIESRIDVAVIGFGMDQPLFRRLTENGIYVLVMVGTDSQARRAFFCGANGLIAQGSEAGGHLAGDTEALTFLPRALEIAHGRPVFLAGGIATAADTTAALAAGANGVVAGTRFLLTREACASRVPAPDPGCRQHFSNHAVRARLAGSSPRRGECRNPAVVPRERQGQAGAAAPQRRQPAIGQTSRPGGGIRRRNAEVVAAAVLPPRPDGRHAGLVG